MAGEGCGNTGARAESAAVPFAVYFAWILSVPMGHNPAVIWPGLSLSEVAPVVGQAIVGLFKYTTGSLPNAARATEIRWLLLNSTGVSGCTNFVSLSRKASAWRMPAKSCHFSWRGRYSSRTVI